MKGEVMDIREALEFAAAELIARSYEIGTNPLNWVGPNAESHPEVEHKAQRLRLAAQALRDHHESLTETSP
jgi:hypothetical protein